MGEQALGGAPPQAEDARAKWEDAAGVDCAHTHHGRFTICDRELRRRSDEYPDLVEAISQFLAAWTEASVTWVSTPDGPDLWSSVRELAHLTNCDLKEDTQA